MDNFVENRKLLKQFVSYEQNRSIKIHAGVQVYESYKI